MNFTLTYLLMVILVLMLIITLAPHVAKRLRMERRASRLLAQHPDAEKTAVYLKLNSTFAAGKEREIEIKISEMEQQGWIFLRLKEANPLRTIRSWRGGLSLEFIRKSIVA